MLGVEADYLNAVNIKAGMVKHSGFAMPAFKVKQTDSYFASSANTPNDMMRW